MKRYVIKAKVVSLYLLVILSLIFSLDTEAGQCGRDLIDWRKTERVSVSSLPDLSAFLDHIEQSVKNYDFPEIQSLISKCFAVERDFGGTYGLIPSGFQTFAKLFHFDQDLIHGEKTDLVHGDWKFFRSLLEMSYVFWDESTGTACGHAWPERLNLVNLNEPSLYGLLVMLTADKVNLRYEPSLDAKVIKQTARDDIWVSNSDTIIPDPSSSLSWLKVTQDDSGGSEAGYIAARYLQLWPTGMLCIRQAPSDESEWKLIGVIMGGD